MDNQLHKETNAQGVHGRKTTIFELAGTSRLLIENHYGIACYDTGSIRVCTSFGTAQITGKNLTFDFVTKFRLMICGAITDICLT